MFEKIQIIDSHVHFNLAVENPVEDLIEQTKNNNISGFVLILNNQKDFDLYFNNIETFKKQDIKIHVAIFLDIHDAKKFRKNCALLSGKGIFFSVKLHPRIHDIRAKDFNKIVKILKNTKFKNIIVDGFVYGSNIENHIFLPLSIMLAKKFPDKKIIIAHFGSYKVLETMLCTRDLKNIIYDVAYTCLYFSGTSVEMDLKHCLKYCYDRVLFGSDYPYFSVQKSKEKMDELLKDGSTEMLSKIYHKNTKEFFYD